VFLGHVGVHEDFARGAEQEGFVVAVVREPPQFLPIGVDQPEVLLHALDELHFGHAGIARQRRVADEVRSLDALAKRRLTGEGAQCGQHSNDRNAPDAQPCGPVHRRSPEVGARAQRSSTHAALSVSTSSC
jgi:hypothetical protein